VTSPAVAGLVAGCDIRSAGKGQLSRPETERKRMPLLWIIVLILVILAVGGGVAVSNLLWLLLVIALIVAIFAVMSGRRV
jgi:uncharacterized membrane protein